MSLQPDPVSGVDPSGATLRDRIGRAAATIGATHFPASERASLRRMGPGSPPPLAFYRFWFRHFDDGAPDESQTSAWMVLLSGLAAAPPNAHLPSRGLGVALSDSGWNESRLERLLAAEGVDIREKLVSDALRFLASRGQRFDWSDVARLLLARSDAALDSIHRRIATDYYRHLSRAETKE